MKASRLSIIVWLIVLVGTLQAAQPDPPTINGISSGYYNINQSFTISGDDGATIEYSLNNGTDWLPYSSEVTLSDEGTYNVVARQTVESETSDETALITLIIDKTNPSIFNISVDPSLAKLGTIVSIEFDATDANGISSNPSVTVNGRVASFQGVVGDRYTYTYTVVVADSDGAASISISATDEADNTGSLTNTTSLTVDQTPPSISGVLATPSLANLGTEVTIQFDATDANGIPSNPTVTVNGRTASYENKIGNTYSYKYTIVAEDGNGTASIFISASDAAGNTATLTNTTALTVDKTAPQVSSITRVSTSPTNLASVQFLVTFNETVTGVTADNFSLSGTSGGTIGSISGTGSTRTVTVTTGVDGTLKLNLTNVAGITDMAGNNLANTYSDGEEYLIDKTVPSVVSINRVTSTPTNLSTVQFTITFSENVTGVTVGNFSLSGTSSGSSISGIANSGSTRTVSVNTGTDGTLRLDLTSVTGIVDAAGNILSSTYSSGQEYTVDKTPPSAPNVTGEDYTKIVRPIWSWSSTGGGNGTFRYKFNDSNLESGATVTTQTTYTHGVDLPDGSYTFYVQERDVAGNWSSSGSKTTIVDTYTQAPTLTLPASNSSSSRYISVNFYLPEAALLHSVKMIFQCTDLPPNYSSVADRIITFSSLHEVEGNHTFTLDGAELDNPDPLYSNHIFEVFTTGSAGKKLIDKGTYSVTLQYQDALGNAIASVINTNFFYSSIPPTGEFVEVDPNPRNTNVGTVQIIFSPRVKNTTVDKGDFTLNRNFEGVDYPVDISGIPSITYSDYSTSGSFSRNFFLNLSSVTQDEGIYTLTLVASGSGIYDASNNYIVDNATLSWTCDKTPPSITLSSTTPSPTNSSPFPVTATVSEQVLGFTESDINVVDASISDFQQNPPGSNTYTFNVNPLYEGLIKFQVPANAFTDLAGNNNTASQQISIFYDATAPQPEISSILASPTNQTIIPVRIDFGEVVTGFTVDDISVSGGTKSSFATSNNRIFTFNLSVSTPGVYIINVGAGVCSDIAGNSSLAATPFSIVFDNSTPSLSSVDIVSNHTNNKWARVGRKVTLSFTANEQIKDVVTSIHGHNVIASTTDNLTWTASYTLIDEDDEGIISFSINYNDLAGNPGSQVNNTNFGGTNVTFDKTKPVISNVGISTNNPSGIYAKPGDRVNVTFTVDDPNLTLDAKIRGVAAALEGGPLTWTAYRNMLVSDVEGFVTFSVTATDLAGNVSISATSTDNDSWVIFDKTPPVISSVTVNSGVYKVGDVIVVHIVSDDDLYSKGTAMVNGREYEIVNNKDNTYRINYTVQSGDVEHNAVSTFPVTISLVDIAGNISSIVNAAQVQGGTLTLDSSIPTISSITSDGEEAGNLIIGSTLTFTVAPATPELGLTVKPQSYNSKPLLWSTVDGTIYNATYTVEEGDNTQVVPLPLGDVTLTDPAGNVSAPENYIGVNKAIYATRPTARILGTTSLCISPGLSVPITFELTGYAPFEIIYRIGAGANITTTSNELTKIVDITGLTPGVYEVTLVKLIDSKGNFIETAIQNAVITLHQLPIVTLNITASPFKPDEPPIILAPFASPPNGIFSGVGVGTDGRFYPSIVNQDETITITYTYTNPATGCVNSATDDVLVTSGGAAIVNLAAHYCQYSEPALITGSNPDPENITGSFVVSAPVNTWVDNNNNTLTLFPQLMFEGNYQVTYSYEDGGSVYEVTRNFLIDSVSTDITFTGLLDKYCENSTSSTLVAINLYPTGGSGHFFGPVGGFFSEPNSNQAQFVPANLTPDQTYTVSYYYLSPRGCSSDTTTLYPLVSSLPSVNFQLNHNYNYLGVPVNLMENASPQGGTFTGIGITNDSWLRPDLVTPGTTTNIKYAFTNVETGCSNDITKPTLILRATETIIGLLSEYCYSDDEIEISCVPNYSPSIVGNFFSKKEGAIVPTGDNQALYRIATAGDGVDTVFYRYSIEGTLYEVFKRVVIDSIGQVSIDLLESEYCNYVSQVNLVGHYNINHGQGYGVFEYNGTSTAFVNQGNVAFFYPAQELPGDYLITFTYQSSITSCSSQITREVTIHPAPTVRFAISQSCTDFDEPVEFINNTVSYDEITNWTWNFNNQGVSYDFEPSFLFSTAGTKQIWLTATTINNCTVTKDSTVVIGVVPKANFTWRNECLNQEETIFTSTSGELNIANYLWVFDDGTEILGPSQSNVSYQFENLGQHSVKLVLTSTDNCKDSLTKQILIKPLIVVDETLNGFYLEDFEQGEAYWDARGLVENGYFSWDFGYPSGQVINYPSSGSNAWYTVIDINNQKVEKSQVVSPCFDLQLLEKPMLKLNIWSHPEVGRDGTVLQYDENGDNNWVNLGSVGDGINWFNSSTIQSQPGGLGQFFGWSNIRMNDWVTARISLDEISDKSNVRFRIAYATDGNALNPFDGFAFDDVWIGARKREVLVEYFTNNTLSSSVSTNSYMHSFETNNSTDLRAIHYHTSSPSGDPLFSSYPSGPLAREFYYGIGTVPYALINGNQPLNLANTVGNQTIIERESLMDPFFDLSVNCSQGESVIISISANALEGFSGKDFSLHCAIVEKQVEIGNAPNGEPVFYNVLREFLPNPGGTYLPSTMNSGNTVSREFIWSPTNIHSLSNARVVAFVQNNSTKEVVQSAYFDLSSITTNPVFYSSLKVNLYPNPASTHIWIESPEIIEEIVIVDVTGRIVSMARPYQMNFNVEVGSLKNGVYLVKLKSSKGEVFKRMVKQ